jgi:hypothetical protein
MKIDFQKNIYYTPLVFILFFLALIYFSTNFDPAHTSFGPWLNLSWNDSYQNILDREINGDDAAYINMGKGFVEQGILKSSYNNYLSLWTPGLPFLHALIISLCGININPIPIFYFFLVIIWSVIFSKYFFDILNIKNITVKITLLFFLFYVLQSKLLNIFFLRQGLIISEGLSSALFILSLSLLYDLDNKSTFKKSFFVAIFLIWSALTRATIDLFISLLIFSYLILYFTQLFYKSMSENKKFLNKLFLWPGSKGLFTVLVIYFLALLPYRLAAHNAWGGFNLVNPKTNWAHSWMPDSYLNSVNAGWIIVGGGNIPCHLNPNACNKIYLEESKTDFPYARDRFDYYRDLTLQTIRQHPWLWLSSKYKVLIEYWFASPPDIAAPSLFERSNLIIFSLFIFCFIWALLNIKIANLKDFFLGRNSNIVYDTIIPISMIAAFIFPQFFIHFEVRYFYPAKVYVFFLMISLITRQFGKKNNFPKFL